MSSADAVYDLVVVGGGPAGSTAAARAASSGLGVLLLEAGSHPRAHVGESLLPGIIPILEQIGALDAVASAGFCRKSGSTHWGWGTTPRWDLWFRDTDEYDHAWLVDRARFDEILFEAAKRAGADVRDGAVVKEVLEDRGRVRGVTFRERGGSLVSVEARWVLDASGGARVVCASRSTQEVIEGLRHQCSWAHWRSDRALPAPREQQALFVAEEGHWLWFFPVAPDTRSVGLVRPSGSDVDYDQAVLGSPLAPLLEGGERITSIRHERDWSYRVDPVCGEGWIACGDCAGFIDPVLSTGVFVAMHSAWHAAELLAQERRGELSEDALLATYQRHHRELFDDLLSMVRFYYQQNLSADDYFWRSKEILAEVAPKLRPQRAFLILTSGLVQNLALATARDEAELQRGARTQGGGRLPHELDSLDFVCFKLIYRGVEPAADLYLLIEPTNPGAPSLFRTSSFDINCIAPRFDNDPIREPKLEPLLRRVGSAIDALDDRGPEPLVDYWQRCGHELSEVVATLEEIELERTFGQ